MRVLITGICGAIGALVAEELAQAGHTVRGFDRAPANHPFPHAVGELVDQEALGAAMNGIDVVVHLAATPDHADFVTNLIPNNVVGAYRLFEAARLANVGRVIFASTGRVASAMEAGPYERPIGVADGFLPGDFYSLTKCYGELLAEMYARQHAISVVCVRIGWFVRNHAEAQRISASPAMQDIYLSHRDTRAFFASVVASPGARFEQVFLTSYNGGRARFDLEPTRRVAPGFEPRDSWPEGSSWET